MVDFPAIVMLVFWGVHICQASVSCPEKSRGPLKRLKVFGNVPSAALANAVAVVPRVTSSQLTERKAIRAEHPGWMDEFSEVEVARFGTVQPLKHCKDYIDILIFYTCVFIPRTQLTSFLGG